MEELIFECETITPMFLAGADGITPELRAPSIKGAIRFWWRAMHPDLGLHDLKKKEAEIFGGSGEGEGKSKVMIKIQIGRFIPRSFNNFNLDTISVDYGHHKVNVNLKKYLALGMFGMGRDPDHKYIPEETSFNILVRFPKMYKEEIKKVFLCLHFIGNIGAKSRNGFGSIKIKNFEEVFQETMSVIEFIKQNASFANLPKYLAFSNHMKVFRGQNKNSWNDALSFIGKAYLKSRIQIDTLHHFDKRKYIAFPVNTRNDIVTHFINDRDRHAKPYFFKVLIENNNFVPYIFYFPSEYVSGINNLEGYRGVNEEQETNNFLEACNQLNTKLLLNGFSEVQI